MRLLRASPMSYARDAVTSRRHAVDVPASLAISATRSGEFQRRGVVAASAGRSGRAQSLLVSGSPPTACGLGVATHQTLPHRPERHRSPKTTMNSSKPESADSPVYPDPFEEARPWAVHLALFCGPAGDGSLQSLAEAHASDPSCLQAKVGVNKLQLPSPTPLLLRDGGFVHCVYAVYDSTASLEAARDRISSAVEESDQQGSTQQCWLSYGKGGGGDEGDLVWIIGFEATERFEHLVEDWAAALPYMASNEGFRCARCYTALEGSAFPGVNIASFDSIPVWRDITGTAESARVHSAQGHLTRIPGIFETTWSYGSLPVG